MSSVVTSWRVIAFPGGTVLPNPFFFFRDLVTRPAACTVNNLLHLRQYFSEDPKRL